MCALVDVAVAQCMSCAESGGEDWNTYTALKSADEEAFEDLAGLVAVADVLEGLGGVLAADVEEDFFTAGVLVYEAWRERKVVSWELLSGGKMVWRCWIRSKGCRVVVETYWCSRRPCRG